MQKWEYLYLSIYSSLSSGRKFEYSLNNERHEESLDGYPSERPSDWKLLNRLGEQGWELVAVPVTAPGRADTFIFKRPKQNKF